MAEGGPSGTLHKVWHASFLWWTNVQGTICEYSSILYTVIWLQFNLLTISIYQTFTIPLNIIQNAFFSKSLILKTWLPKQNISNPRVLVRNENSWVSNQTIWMRHWADDALQALLVMLLCSQSLHFFNNLHVRADCIAQWYCTCSMHEALGSIPSTTKETKRFILFIQSNV